MCESIGQSCMAQVTALHRALQAVFQEWSKKHSNEGFLLCACVGRPIGSEDLKLGGSDLGGDYRLLFFLSRVELSKRFSILTLVEEVLEGGAVAAAASAKLPIRVQLMVDGAGELLHQTSWQLAMELYRAEPPRKWFLYQLDFSSVTLRALVVHLPLGLPLCPAGAGPSSCALGVVGEQKRGSHSTQTSVRPMLTLRGVGESRQVCVCVCYSTRSVSVFASLKGGRPGWPR